MKIGNFHNSAHTIYPFRYRLHKQTNSPTTKPFQCVKRGEDLQENCSTMSSVGSPLERLVGIARSMDFARKTVAGSIFNLKVCITAHRILLSQRLLIVYKIYRLTTQVLIPNEKLDEFPSHIQNL